MLKYQCFSYIFLYLLKDIKQDLQMIRRQISQVTSDIPHDQLTAFSDTLGSLQGATQNVTPMLDMAEEIR